MKPTFPTIPTATIPTNYQWGAYHPELYPAPSGRHMGCDFAGAVGSPIYAACDGKVREVSLVNLHGYGRHVYIKHEEFQTLYAHLHTVTVVMGQEVKSGDVIGSMGGDPKDDDLVDGASGGSHLHFEVVLPFKPAWDFVEIFSGFTVDPIPYLMARYAEPAAYELTVTAPRGVRVRTAASITGKIIGGLAYGTKVLAFDLWVNETGDETWVKLWTLRPEWAAYRYEREVLMRVDVYPPEPEPEPILDEKAIRRDEIERLMGILQGRLNELA